MKGMRVRCLFLVSLLVSLQLSGCGKSGGGDDPGAAPDRIVRVGNEILSAAQLESMIQDSDRTAFSIEEKAALVQNWVEVELLHNEAVKRGLQNDPAIKSRLLMLRKELLADQLVFLELQERVKVTEREIEEYFRKNEREYTCEFRVSHILVNTEEEAETALELLKTNTFAWVANRHSIDPVAKRGGDLGYLTKGNMIPEFEGVVFGMQPGETSGIVQSALGYHIIQLTEVREARVSVSPAEVREQIVSTLLMEKRKEAYREFFESLTRSGDIEYYNKIYEPGNERASSPGAAYTTGDTSGRTDTLSREETGEGL